MNRNLIACAAVTCLLAACDSTSPVNSENPVGDASGGAKTCVQAAAEAADFYTPPDPLPPGQPGDLIRCEAVTTTLSDVAKATRIMYLSTDVHGEPMAVTGTVLDPLVAWTGSGQRPLVGFTVGTQGQGDQCAPSRLLAEGVHYSPPSDLFFEYESAFLLDDVTQGMAVVVTDYQGLGTPGAHTYVNRVAEAHANIDAVRAAQRLVDSGIPADGPVGFAGYSQGGGAAAATAELVGAYGSELKVVGTYAGAPPADLYQTFSYADGGGLVDVMGYYLNGIENAFPEAVPVIDAEMNDAGKQMMARTLDQCVAETLAEGFHPSSDFTVRGKAIPEVLNENPVTRSILEGDRIGGLTPSAPVLLATGSNDDIVPPDGVRALAATWCQKGATVELYETGLPLVLPGTAAGHISNAPLIYAAIARTWLRDRFAGVPAPNTCDGQAAS